MFAPPSTSDGGLSLAAGFALGVLQGATEFLPVSSSGHLALAQAWLGIDPARGGHRMSVVVHAGTLLAVLWTYRRDLPPLVRALLPGASAPALRREVAALVVATLPLILVLWAPARTLVATAEGSVRIVGACLCWTGVLLATSRWARPRDAGPPSLPRACLVGLAQLVAVLPGVSRSGSTICAALLLGVDRGSAARFSFLLSIPAVLGAVGLEVLEVSGEPAGTGPAAPFIAGFVASFLVGLACLRWLLRVVGRGRLYGFAPYVLLLGTLALAFGGGIP
jgi:undecaprenyl-diphosphatase